MANRSISMDVTAEAIQADNFTPAMDEDGFITGWFMSDGTTPVTPDNYNNQVRVHKGTHRTNRYGVSFFDKIEFTERTMHHQKHRNILHVSISFVTCL